MKLMCYPYARLWRLKKIELTSYWLSERWWKAAALKIQSPSPLRSKLSSKPSDSTLSERGSIRYFLMERNK